MADASGRARLGRVLADDSGGVGGAPSAAALGATGVRADVPAAHLPGGAARASRLRIFGEGAGVRLASEHGADGRARLRGPRPLRAGRRVGRGAGARGARDVPATATAFPRSTAERSAATDARRGAQKTDGRILGERQPD